LLTHISQGYGFDVSSARREKVAAIVATSGEATFAQLADRFDVSEMTIRRDLETLELEGLVRRVRGGAIPVVGRSHEPPISERGQTNMHAKQAIGKAAATLLQDGETVIVDIGTTTLECARALSGFRRLTIVTASLLVAQELSNAPGIRTLLAGGVMRPGEMSLIGHRAEDSFADLNCDTIFLGVGGVDTERGLTEYNLDDARVKQAALRAARRCVLLADGSKFGRITFATIAPLSRVDVLVTDASPDHPLIVQAVDAGVEVVHVPTNPQEGR
jgi:DeoR/GlpR family transcriptional regulator of sugar metabolism